MAGVLLDAGWVGGEGIGKEMTRRAGRPLPPPTLTLPVRTPCEHVFV
jgi:hypothetical protein